MTQQARTFLVFSLLLPVTSQTMLAQWEPTAVPPTVYVGTILTHDEYVVAGTDSATYVSSDGGISWVHPANLGMQNRETVYGLAFKGSFLFAATARSGVFRSTDFGSNWQAVSNGLPPGQTTGLAVGDSGIFVGTVHGVYFSSDDGSSWQPRNAGMTGQTIWPVVFGSGKSGRRCIYAGATRPTGGLFLSTNNGLAWSSVTSGLADSIITSLSFGLDSTIFASSGLSGVYHSTDEGATWQQTNTGLTSPFVQALQVLPYPLDEQCVLAGSETGGVFLSTNGGINWRAANTGLPSLKVNALGINSTYVFAGMLRAGGVYRRWLLDILASVDREPLSAPLQFSLEQNYPNPFNPLTTIEFELPVRSAVTLHVFDLLGREVAWLATRQVLGAGTHRLALDGGSLSSGVYFYELSMRGTGGNAFRQVKKMTVVK